MMNDDDDVGIVFLLLGAFLFIEIALIFLCNTTTL